jgi:RNase adapter protein RapZ
MTGGSRQTAPPANGSGGARVPLVTGMSGARRSTALKILEDMGYEAFDNLPLSLVPALIENAAADAPVIAVSAHARIRGFAIQTLPETLDRLRRGRARQLRMLFIDCDDDCLERRYTETRRPHPLASDRPDHGSNPTRAPSALPCATVLVR